MPYLSADSVDLFYRDWGTGAPVVFTHTWALSSAMWQYQAAALADRGLRCVTYDRRGHGRSDQPGGGYDFDTLADDLATVIERLDLRDVTLVGHSTGTGEIVRYLARHGSDRVARIVLVSSALPFMLRTPDNPDGLPMAAWDEMRAQWRTDFAAWARRVAEPLFGVGLPGISISRALIDWSTADSHATSVKAMLDLSHAVSETDHRADLRAIAVPALVIHGAADEFNPLPLCGELTASLIPDSRLKVYDNGPHGLYLTHREQLTADLLEFIEGGS
ncbi:alpha/beta hydrolase [Nocardia terpenica]|uniref:alpha/beta fold hydrolase n=1 Tax=Nocardia terpenica TaxID=455432 RepID=UPI0018961B30|nr:alpha/beta hydrolase [Nocardia terpenica]MBF6064797.1 alpha/beta hydrolase [Nocardia terpenica]MBF6107312.1 alpha/beta hydrolase [Nocardia terpenica]MBF6115069.1 alpha/beta hydrolase [Nocardia terpenica]MBF6122175.1 alpha/beta hydrolase [Nocardia terpenica]MBF6154558.1 alpha/beta hydrolase [Nocardia terpenica]